MNYINYIWPVLLMILGILMFLKPKLLWRIQYFLIIKDGEPTDLYLALMRIGGIFFTAASIILLVISFS